MMNETLSEPASAYYLQYSVYNHGEFVVTRVARFPSKAHATSYLKQWRDNKWAWQYEDLKEVSEKEYLSGLNKVNHLDFQEDTDFNNSLELVDVDELARYKDAEKFIKEISEQICPDYPDLATLPSRGRLWAIKQSYDGLALALEDYRNLVSRLKTTYLISDDMYIEIYNEAMSDTNKKG